MCTYARILIADGAIASITVLSIRTFTPMGTFVCLSYTTTGHRPLELRRCATPWLVWWVLQRRRILQLTMRCTSTHVSTSAELSPTRCACILSFCVCISYPQYSSITEGIRAYIWMFSKESYFPNMHSMDMLHQYSCTPLKAKVVKHVNTHMHCLCIIMVSIVCLCVYCIDLRHHSLPLARTQTFHGGRQARLTSAHNSIQSFENWGRLGWLFVLNQQQQAPGRWQAGTSTTMKHKQLWLS